MLIGPFVIYSWSQAQEILVLSASLRIVLSS